MDLSRFLFSYPLHRALVAGLSFVAAIISARLLPPEIFSTLMTAVFLVKFLQILNFGATAGYFVSRYAQEGALAQGKDGAERRYLLFFVLQLLGLGVLAFAVSALWLPQYLVGAIAFLLIVPSYAVEPYLRYRRNFSFSLVPDLLLAAGLLSLVLLHSLSLGGESMVAFLVVIAVLALFVWLLAMGKHVPSSGATSFGLSEYSHVLSLGAPVYFGSALFLVASSMDRLLLPLYGDEQQISIYFLAHQLSVGSMIFVTAINFVNAINLGEARQDRGLVDSYMVAAKLRSAGLVALGSYVALLAGTFVLEEAFLPDSFDGLAHVVLILGAGLAFFFTSNAITPLVAYFRRQIPLTVSMGVVTLALAANNAWIYWSGLGPIWLAAGTAMALIVHAGFATWFTFFVLRQQSWKPQAHIN